MTRFLKTDCSFTFCMECAYSCSSVKYMRAVHVTYIVYGICMSLKNVTLSMCMSNMVRKLENKQLFMCGGNHVTQVQSMADQQPLLLYKKHLEICMHFHL
jgi:hypothetical protein